MGISFDRAFPRSDEFPPIRKIQDILYTYSRKGLFNLLSVIIGMVLSIVWGLVMGIVQFALIWFIYPYLVKYNYYIR